MRQGCNLAVDEELENVRFLVHDRDAKFAAPFDVILRDESVRVIRTPVRAPRANASPSDGSDRPLRVPDDLLVVGRRTIAADPGGSTWRTTTARGRIVAGASRTDT